MYRYSNINKQKREKNEKKIGPEKESREHSFMIISYMEQKLS
jgi:hypothetical protein